MTIGQTYNWDAREMWEKKEGNGSKVHLFHDHTLRRQPQAYLNFTWAYEYRKYVGNIL
jgi:hypothetical protein